MKRLYFLLILIFCHHTISAQWQQTNGPYGGNIQCFVSSNNGISWTQTNNGLQESVIYSMAVNGTTLYAGTKGGLYQSTNNGNSWNLLSNGIPTTMVSSLTVSAGNVFAGISQSGVYKSSDDGISWNAVNNGLSNLNV